jgi:hypothetical protein
MCLVLMLHRNSGQSSTFCLPEDQYPINGKEDQAVSFGKKRWAVVRLAEGRR